MNKLSKHILKVNKSVFIIISLLFLLGCTASINELKTKRDAGEATFVTYDQAWETVYEDIKYVLHHSENSCIADQLSADRINYAIEEKAIYIKGTPYGSTNIGLFFEPIPNNWTKVAYVKADFVGGLYSQCIIDGAREEVSFLRKHGQEIYREYTYKLHEQRLHEQSNYTLAP